MTKEAKPRAKSGAVTLRGHIIVPEADLEAVMQALPTHIRLTREEPECLVFDVQQRADATQYFDVFEQFANQNAFEQHQQRVKTSKWGQVAKRVERHYSVTVE